MCEWGDQPVVSVTGGIALRTASRPAYIFGDSLPDPAVIHPEACSVSAA